MRNKYSVTATEDDLGYCVAKYHSVRFWYRTLPEAIRSWRVTIVALDCGIWKTEVN